jgi:hypothetical protein
MTKAIQILAPVIENCNSAAIFQYVKKSGRIGFLCRKQTTAGFDVVGVMKLFGVVEVSSSTETTFKTKKTGRE